jgi:hypothetical protein
MTLLRDESSSWGRCPHTPGIYRIPARMTERGGRSLGLRSFRPLSRRSGCVPAVPYPPLRSFQSGLLQPRRAMIYQRTATAPLTSCLTPGVQFTLNFPPPAAPSCILQVISSLRRPIVAVKWNPRPWNSGVRARAKRTSRPGYIEKRAGHGRESILWLIRTSRERREVTVNGNRRRY